jgi:hypothetical protein
VIFLRPSSFGGGVQSSIFDVSQGPPNFVGIVSAGTKLAYATAPSLHRFMVIGESADFMDAEFVLGKTYYALVEPRMGAWKARFSLRPVNANDRDLARWLDSCTWVENTPGSTEWARNHMIEIQEKQVKYLAAWQQQSDKPVLRAVDSR